MEVDSSGSESRNEEVQVKPAAATKKTAPKANKEESSSSSSEDEEKEKNSRPGQKCVAESLAAETPAKKAKTDGSFEGGMNRKLVLKICHCNILRNSKAMFTVMWIV